MTIVSSYAQSALTFGLQIGSGYHGEVFRLIPGSKVIKLYRSEGEFLAPTSKEGLALRNAEQEHTIASDLFGNGISAPKSFGIYSIRLWRINHPWELVHPLHLTGWLRTYIPGKCGAELSLKQELHLEKLVGIELHKARDVGYRFPDDAWSSKNVILQPNGRIVLIDFLYWKKQVNQ